MPTLRWGDDGGAVEVSPSQAFVDHELLKLLNDQQAFGKALQPLLQASFVRRGRRGVKIQVPQMVQQLVRWRLGDQGCLAWTKKAICLVAHAFPEESALNESFDTLRTNLSPHVYRCIEHAKRYSPADFSEIMEQMIGMLLSTLGRSGKEEWLLDYTDKLLERRSCDYHRLLAAKWRAYW